MQESQHLHFRQYLSYALFISHICFRLKRRLGRNKSEEPESEKERLVGDFNNHIETGFQLATFQGPLCAEPVEGMAYFVESVEIDSENLGKEIGSQKFCSKNKKI